MCHPSLTRANQTRLMEGVRRWIGANHTTLARNPYGELTAKSEVRKTPAGPEVDPQSTETIATQLLDPIVSEEEEAEYQGFVCVLRFPPCRL